MTPACIGLIDPNRLSRDCLQWLIIHANPQAVVIPFADIAACKGNAEQQQIDILIYHEDPAALFATRVREIESLREAYPSVPLIVLSEAEGRQHADAIRIVMQSGVKGFIPTRTTGVAVTLAAIKFVEAGGTFAPLAPLLNDEPSPPQRVEAAPKPRLTNRQLDVLNHLRLGHANKTIAAEMGMSENTVKVHVRNIMRALGATTRRRAVYVMDYGDAADPGANPGAKPSS